MHSYNITFGLAAVMLILSTGSASAFEAVTIGNSNNSQMSTESGSDGASYSSTNESSVDTSASQTNSSYQSGSSANTYFNTEASSLATSESGLVLVGGPAGFNPSGNPSGIPPAFAFMDNPNAWGVPHTIKAKSQPIEQPAREIHMQVKYYNWKK